MVAKTIAQYRILEELGRGGMGTVYKALDTQLDRTVVLKLLLRDRISDDESRRRFMREARLASALDHPNICTIYEIQQTDGFLYIAMQYVAGQTLKKAISGRPLSTPTIVSIALQVADALAAAHDRGIVHRDVKPQNIMLTPRGRVVILDFGLAKSLDEPADPRADGQDLTTAGSTIGTPAYMAPEQIRSERVDRRADIFALGVVIYEMTTGRKPFVAKNNVDLMHAVCHDLPAPIATYNPDAPPELQAIVDRAMAKHPSDRYQSANDLLADLKRLAAAAEGAPAVPDGIARAFAPVARVSWWRQLLPRSLRQAPADLTQSTSAVRQMSEANTSQIAPPPVPVDDFPIIPGPHKTLAVLPFRSLGNAADTAWSLSLLETLIAQLAEFKSLTIRPASYVREYIDREVDPIEVGRDLRADAVLLGSFLRSEDRLRVTTQLIDINTSDVLWAGKVDADAADAIRLQDEICQRLVARLSGTEKPTSPLDLLHDESEEIRLEAAAMLKFSRDPAAVAALADALGDESSRVKSAACDALAKFGRQAAPAVSARLEEAMQAGDFATARVAARTAGQIGSPELLPILLEALGAEDGRLAAEAALALGSMRDARARPDLLEALNRRDANVRFTSTQALGLLADPRDLEALEARLWEDEDEGVRAKALWAIMHIRRGARADAAAASAAADSLRAGMAP